MAKLKSQKSRDAQGESVKAAEQRYKAAQGRIKSAQFEIESRQAQLEGITLRGAEAIKVREVLSQPPLRLPKASSNEIANVRLSHANALTRAFRAYRALVRYMQAANIPEANIPKLSRPDLTGDTQSWAERLKDWIPGAKFSAENLGALLLDLDKIDWELTPEQIKALFTQNGLHLIITPRVKVNGGEIDRINTEPSLFTVPVEWQKYLDEFSKLNDDSVGPEEKQRIKSEFGPGFRALWIQEFLRQNISISDDINDISVDNNNISIDNEGANFTWRITDRTTRPVELSFKFPGNANPSRLFLLESEPVSFSVKRLSADDSTLLVSRRNKEQKELGRSVFPDRIFQNVESKIARTGRISGIFLTGKIRGTNDFLESETTEYDIDVIHQGNYFAGDVGDQFSVQLRNKKKLQGQRVSYIPPSKTSKQALQQVLIDQKEFFRAQGDPDIFSVQGITLSGTTVIKLIPQSNDPPQFEQLELNVLFSFFE